MKIQCLDKRPGTVVIPIGNDTYHFAANDKGDKVAEVWNEDHVKCFIEGVPHLYRPYGAEEPAKAESATPSPPPESPLIAIKGIGSRLVATLAEQGVTTLEQIAAWKDEDVTAIEAKLTFKGRIAREKWVEQAQALLKLYSEPGYQDALDEMKQVMVAVTLDPIVKPPKGAEETPAKAGISQEPTVAG